ncbi:type II toxin-antitoxin system VapC family toxin [Methanoregula sp.]|jgi:predicted nucleic acid-binding protein|uniref:type II toxin-antitoxin system VapC family toxin n=1 Tax=Methanoregula sp. TaxID=2052170 RepID=UPI0026133EF4|nr:type II toxin-antitoxin system VapC family toxin [Methanoregula sp.]MDD5141910.1 type II toxin-antitoxin system VapC family toxin [Methanoregula sp.]
MTFAYIETSALFRAYTREAGSDIIDEVFSQMEAHRVTGLISNLSIPEIIRGIIKRKNLRELSEDEAQKIIDSILFDLNTRIMNNELAILGLDKVYLPEVNQIIRNSNFYVIDAIQLVTAHHAAPALFLHADTHFSTSLVDGMVHPVDIRKPGALKTVSHMFT